MRIDEYGEPVGFISIMHKVTWYQRKIRDELSSMFPNVPIEFKNLKTYCAYIVCDPKSITKIVISNYTLTLNPAEIWDIINHEIAHYLADIENGKSICNHRDPTFIRICKTLNCSPLARSKHKGYWDFVSIKFPVVKY